MRTTFLLDTGLAGRVTLGGLVPLAPCAGKTSLEFLRRAIGTGVR